MVMQIKVSPGGNRPIYKQIIDQVRQAVSSGELEVGASLPSVRQLAEELVINHNTVAKAYAELVREGTLESLHGRGVIVAKRRSVFSAAERKRRFQNALDAFIADVSVLGYSAEQIQAEVAAKLESFAATE
jgi:GntR family transcriptional regulator